MNVIKFWYKNARPQSLPQSILPATAAFVTSTSNPNFVWWLGLLSIAGVGLEHLSINLFDDYFDYRVKKSDFRDRLAHKGIRARIHKCRYLVSGQTTPNKLLVACLVTGGTAALSGFIILYFRGVTVFYIAAAAALIGVMYSGPPLKLSYRGLGEATIGLMFGPLSMVGVYFSSCGQIDPSVLFISIPVGLLVANIIYVHSIMDYEPDLAVGKVTLAVALKTKPAMIAALAIILTATYISIVAGIIFGSLSPYYLLTMATIPIAIRLFYLMVQFVKNPERQFDPEWWLGPFGDFENIKKIGIGWFMVRWITARNLLSFFCLIIMLTVIVFKN
ncbi:MAG: prenyltransferase [Dysgonamonadaceae bacterium]|jgi:1,4-dihydroxy-2-naphthoate octaprenyltransferase|nr:prenyltransferase [Dysgonamonadaceae bacterium]